MPSPNWDMKHWHTGKPVSLAESFGFRRELFHFPSLKPRLPAASAESQHPLQVASEGGGVSLGVVGKGTKAFAKAVLKGIDAPVTAANIRSIEAWVQREGGGGTNNPLNTVLKEPGSTDFNSVGVQNYTSINEGVAATVTELQNGDFNDLLAAFKSGKGLMGRSFTGLSTWSGNGYNSIG